MQVSVIVPTYNEKENIESLVTLLLALPTSVHIIVVDDNSPDGTGEIAASIRTSRFSISACASQYPFSDEPAPSFTLISTKQF
jgi:glycosyltransferase involved in cell wall biosynthesis